MRVGVAADVDEQRGVVNDQPVFIAHAAEFGKPKRNLALTKHVFHRLTEAEVNPERQRGDEFGEADLAGGGSRSLRASHGPPPPAQHLHSSDRQTVRRTKRQVAWSCCRLRMMAASVAFSSSVGLNWVSWVPTSYVGTCPGGM